MPHTRRARASTILAAFLVALTFLSAAADASPAEPEIRAFWIEAWSSGIKTPAQVDQLIANVQAGNFNTIIPQVRRRADAFYHSNLEPRTADPAVPAGYDPLADLIAKARAADPPIEVHAWIVVYPIWRVVHSPHPDPNHILNREPDWLTVSIDGATHDGTNYQVDPGHPEAQQHTFDVAMDLVKNYDIDGLHYDYVRYTSRAWGYNPVAVERFNRIHGRAGIPATNDPDWMQFRRDQITQLVRKIYLSAIEVKPEIKISAATITWAPGPANLSQWHSSSAAYRSVLQDWRGWMEEGILDLNVPMAYFREHTHSDDWMKWINFAKDHRYDRHLAIGPGIWLNSIENTIKQIRDTRAPSPAGNFAQGVSGYSYQGTNNQGLPRSEFLHALTQPSAHDPAGSPVFAEPAPIPEMPWKINPQTGHLKGFVRTAEDNLPADGAIVHLAGETERTVQVDATGFFGFVDLPPGDYNVRASWDEIGDETPPAAVSVAKGIVAHQDLQFGERIRPRFTRIATNGDTVLEAELTGHPNAWLLVEASTDLASWLPLTSAVVVDSPASVFDANWQAFGRRFYRARETSAVMFADFSLYEDGETAMFRNPSFSGSTNSHIATGDGLPNFARVSDDPPAGADSPHVLHASWSFATGTSSPWLRLTTYNAPKIPNPTVGFSQGIRFNVHVDRPIHLTLGLRETDSTAPTGGNGGISGDIEWVGGITDNSVTPPLGIPVPAGEWTTVHFFLPHKPVRAHTGDGNLESATGRGVLENLTIVPADGTGIYNLFLDAFHAIELSP